ncbi:MAG TPA: hypothetical protein VNE42_05370 [Acidimicrobiales bacterium]|nr:hypothetical protein [Acidimicrobiales bacterium]
MQLARSEHQFKVEQQLFDVHAHLDVKRAELEFVTGRMADARLSAEEAGARVALAETPLAQREYSKARRRLADLAQRHAEATHEVVSLESTQDALLAKLVG